MSEVDQVLRGAVAFGFAVAGLFFLRFWRDTRDRLFACFAVAFFTLAANRFGLALLNDTEGGDRLYWVRLAAFAMILFAIWDKNRAARVARP
jgi:Family of unknown function (DUF5985)